MTSSDAQAWKILKNNPKEAKKVTLLTADSKVPIA